MSNKKCKVCTGIAKNNGYCNKHDRKGKCKTIRRICPYKAYENGYCGNHTSEVTYNKLMSEKKQVCSNYKRRGCVNIAKDEFKNLFGTYKTKKTCRNCA